CDLDPTLHGGAGSLERWDHQPALAIDTDADLAEQVDDVEKTGLRSPARLPLSSHQASMLGRCLCIDAPVRAGGREIAVGEVLEQLDTHDMGASLAPGAVERHIEADLLRQKQVKRGMEVLRVAKVRDHLAPVDIGLEEAELHAVQRRDERHGVDAV